MVSVSALRREYIHKSDELYRETEPWYLQNLTERAYVELLRHRACSDFPLDHFAEFVDILGRYPSRRDVSHDDYPRHTIFKGIKRVGLDGKEIKNKDQLDLEITLMRMELRDVLEGRGDYSQALALMDSINYELKDLVSFIYPNGIIIII